MLPPPLAAITGITCLENRNSPFNPTSRTKSHSFSVRSAMVFLTVTPALLCRISILPYLATMASTVFFTCSSLVTSHWKKAASRPASRSSFAFSSPLGLISTIAIFAPYADKSSHTPSPIPELPPVITATFPVRFNGSFFCNIRILLADISFFVVFVFPYAIVEPRRLSVPGMIPFLLSHSRHLSGNPPLTLWFFLKQLPCHPLLSSAPFPRSIFLFC